MKTPNDDYQNRLPGHKDPLELPEHAGRSAAVPPMIDETDMAVKPRKGSAFGWAALAALAVIVFLGGLYLVYDMKRDKQSQPQLAGVVPAQLRSAPVSDEYEVTMIDVLPEVDVVATAPSASAGASKIASAPTNDVMYQFVLNGTRVSENQALNQLAAKAVATNGYIDIQGYTDESGSYAYNKRLSEQRAQSVADYLEAHGVPASHIKAVGYGPTHKFSSPTADRCAMVHLRS